MAVTPPMIHRRVPRGIVALLPVLIAGCAAQRAVLGSPSGSQRFINDGWVLGATRVEIRARLGPPLAVRVEPIKNQHDPDRTDAVHVLQYDGLALAFWVGNEEPEREFLTDISVTSARYELGQGLRVGDRKEQVVRRLGSNFTPVRAVELRAWMPSAEAKCDNDACAYRYTDHTGSASSDVYFSFRAGHVSRIDWVFGVD